MAAALLEMIVFISEAVTGKDPQLQQDAARCAVRPYRRPHLTSDPVYELLRFTAANLLFNQGGPEHHLVGRRGSDAPKPSFLLEGFLHIDTLESSGRLDVSF